MATLTARRLTDHVGAELVDIDVHRLLDDDLPRECMQGLEQYGVLLLRGLPIDDDVQVEFCRRLGEVVQFPKYENPNVMVISFDPANPNVNYFPSNDHWHFDGSMDDIPAKAVTLSARVLASDGGETEFASTYAAYDALSDARRSASQNCRWCTRSRRSNASAIRTRRRNSSRTGRSGRSANTRWSGSTVRAGGRWCSDTAPLTS